MSDNGHTAKTIDFGTVGVKEIQITNLLGRDYVLREASGAAAIRYRSQQAEAIRTNEEGTPVGFNRGMIESEATLVGDCLYEVAPVNGVPTVKGRPVGAGHVQTFPSHVLKTLYEKCREISNLDPEDEESLAKQMEVLGKRIVEVRKRKAAGDEAKNSPALTTAGSGSPES